MLFTCYVHYFFLAKGCQIAPNILKEGYFVAKFPNFYKFLIKYDSTLSRALPYLGFKNKKCL